jgi:hypothetical protein
VVAGIDESADLALNGVDVCTDAVRSVLGASESVPCGVQGGSRLGEARAGGFQVDVDLFWQVCQRRFYECGRDAVSLPLMGAEAFGQSLSLGLGK